MNRSVLEKPFEPDQVKQRQGSFGNLLDYVEGHSVIARLNEAFDGNWAFEIVDHQILKETDEVLVLGKLSAGEITKMAFGSKAIARNRDSKDGISLGDDLKAASTDALKKAATLLGVGLYLYSDAGAKMKATGIQWSGRENVEHDNLEQERTGDVNNGRLTNRQLAAIFSIGKSKGLQNKDIKGHAQKIFNKNLDFLTKEEASAFIKALQTVSTERR